MLTYLKGDLFNDTSKNIVITTNIVGAMGKGIALDFKNRYFDLYSIYRKECLEGKYKNKKFV